MQIKKSMDRIGAVQRIEVGKRQNIRDRIFIKKSEKTSVVRARPETS
jgi:carbonic anhydrase/acetyltransferase-like protein (isoleucine patch superfamily)